MERGGDEITEHDEITRKYSNSKVKVKQIKRKDEVNVKDYNFLFLKIKKTSPSNCNGPL